LVLRSPFIQGLGRHIEAVGPDDGPDLRVEAGLGEEARIGERLRDAAPVPIGEVDVADKPVAEGDAELMIADDLGSDDWDELGPSQRGSIGAAPRRRRRRRACA
jgi:hypothetical protein